MSILTATVATVKLGLIEIEGLLFEDGSFGVAIPQLEKLNLVPPNRSMKQLQSLLDISFPSHQKVKTALNSKAVNSINLDDLLVLLKKLSKKGNKVAQDLTSDLIGLSLTQLFSDAFNIKFEQEERQAYLKARQQGKIDRLKLTDGIKIYMEANEISNGSKWYGGCTQNTYLALFGKTKQQLCLERGVDTAKEISPRDFMSSEELKRLAEFENFAAILMVKKNIEPFKAVQQAKEFYS